MLFDDDKRSIVDITNHSTIALTRIETEYFQRK